MHSKLLLEAGFNVNLIYIYNYLWMYSQEKPVTSVVKVMPLKLNASANYR